MFVEKSCFFVSKNHVFSNFFDFSKNVFSQKNVFRYYLNEFIYFYHISCPTHVSSMAQLPLCSSYTRQTHPRKFQKSPKSRNFDENPLSVTSRLLMKYRIPSLSRNFFLENRHVADFERPYLRAQMELESVLGLQEQLRDLIKKIKPTGGPQIASQTSQTKKALFLYYIVYFRNQLLTNTLKEGGLTSWKSVSFIKKDTTALSP